MALLHIISSFSFFLTLLLINRMSSMRWGDSDSSDEDEIKVSSLPIPGQQESPHPPAGKARRSTQQQRERTPPRQSRGSQQHGNTKNPPKSVNNNKNPRNSGRGGGGPPQHEHAKDWKQMAKSSSRFSSTGGTTFCVLKAHGKRIFLSNNSHTYFCLGSNQQQQSIDGSAWMAQRRKKRQEEEQHERIQHEEELRQHEEEKRNRRKSQFSALKVCSHVSLISFL